MTMSVEEAQKQLAKARVEEHKAKVEADTERRAAQARALAEQAEKHRLAENEALRQMVGLTVVAVEYVATAEGELRFTFNDDTVFSVSASGDDATVVTYGFTEKAV